MDNSSCSQERPYGQQQLFTRKAIWTTAIVHKRGNTNNSSCLQERLYGQQQLFTWEAIRTTAAIYKKGYMDNSNCSQETQYWRWQLFTREAIQKTRYPCWVPGLLENNIEFKSKFKMDFITSKWWIQLYQSEFSFILPIHFLFVEPEDECCGVIDLVLVRGVEEVGVEEECIPRLHLHVHMLKPQPFNNV